MSDEPTDTTEDQHDENANIRTLREKAKQADSLAAEKAALERELAFAKAGIPLNDPKSSYFLKGYDGDLTPEQIKQTWDTTFGSQPSAPQIPNEEVQGHQRVAQASEGAGPPPTPSRDDELVAKIRSGEIRGADGVAAFLASQDPDLVAWDGPADASRSIV